MLIPLLTGPMYTVIFTMVLRLGGAWPDRHDDARRPGLVRGGMADRSGAGHQRDHPPPRRVRGDPAADRVRDDHHRAVPGQPFRAGPQRRHVLQLPELPVLRARRHPRADYAAARVAPAGLEGDLPVLVVPVAAGQPGRGADPGRGAEPRHDLRTRICHARPGHGDARPGPAAGAPDRRAGAALMNTLQVMRYAFLSGARDYGSIYTWKTWLGGWFLRVLAQVTFFALLGRLLRSDEQTWFLLVGNATMLAAMEGVWALNMVSWERNTGTLPLLVASPTSPVVVLASRGTYLIGDGVVSALGALFLIGPLDGLVANVGLVTVMTLCGVNVPLSAYPTPVAWVSRFLPLTHGLIAVRDVLDGRLGAAALQALAEAAVGAGWLGVCLLTFGWFIGRGRRDGSLEYAT